MEKLNKLTNAYNNISKLNKWKQNIKLKTIQIKAASSDGRDLAPGTANRWLQNDREQWAICI